ncbi:MAG: translation initiation factor IF-2 [Bacteroidales bacterium]|nr:translation initiation factor IF-2 [Bacteroidales bacterium]
MTSETKPKRLSAVVAIYNVATSTIVDYLASKGIEIESNPNAKVQPEWLALLDEKFKDSKVMNETAIKDTEKAKENKELNISIEKQQNLEKQKQEADKVKEAKEKERLQKEAEIAKAQDKSADATQEKVEAEVAQKPKPHEIQPLKEGVKTEENGPKVLGTINLDQINQKTRPKPKTPAEREEERKQKKEAAKEAQKQAKKAAKQDTKKPQPAPAAKPVVAEPVQEKVEKIEKPVIPEPEFIKTRVEKLQGPNIIGKIDISEYERKQEAAERARKEAKEERQKNREKEKAERKEKRKRIKRDNVKVDINKVSGSNDFSKKGEKSGEFGGKKKKGKMPKKPEINEEDIQEKVKETLAKLTANKNKSKAAKFRKEKRDMFSMRRAEEEERLEAEKKIIKVTEFVSANELATMMGVPVTKIIATCMSLGLFVSINQRLDAETMSIVAEEFGFQVEFVSAEILDEIKESEDKEEDLVPRPPIVTVMGHVDHGKTKLLDYIRHTNVVAGEAGGITQHIGAYSVQLNDKRITFLDTPGHEAFTAMRARGAQITDVAIIVIAADDDIMPQTKEAINHASAANVPIVFAINKIDKPTANPDKIKESLANMNYLVEEWGGKYQSQDISAKAGLNIEELLEKVLLEAEMLDLKANPNKNANGTVIESSLDKGRGYVATLIVQSGTLHVGDILLAGCATGRVKAMYNERNQKVTEAGPSTPVLVLGLNGAPQAGDKFNVLDSEQEARSLANKRLQLQRELSIRTQKHITLGEIGRRMALGDFHQINIIVKGDVDGSIEALSDELIKLSTESFEVNIIHKAVGQISESDVMLAAASNAIIVGFQVRPSTYARKTAEKEGIEIRLYSIIYDAINEIKDAMEGMLKPVVKETITGSAEIREVFKISKVGSVAGCLVTDGKISRKSKVRIIRDGIVIYTGELGSLKRFKDDAKEVIAGQECGLNIDKFNDIKVGDIVEAFDETEVKATLG